MPHYYFHVVHEAIRIEDPEGGEYADLAAAAAEALMAARNLWIAAILEDRDIGLNRFDITDADGVLLGTLAFDDALPLALRTRLGPTTPSASE